MYHLVGNGSHLYRRDSHLVRTPIKLSLTPDDRAYYSVAGEYTDAHWPAHGFIEQNTYDNVWAMGAACIQAYLNPTSALQMWRQVSSSHDPETVWYQGAFATSASSMALSYESCEAYMQLGAYHFSIPQALSALTVTRATVKFINGGGARAYQSASVQSANNATLKGQYDFNTWFMPFAVGQSLVHPSQLGQLPWDRPIDILAETGTFRGARDLWGFSGTSRDGGIVTLNTPVLRSYDLGQYTLANFDAYKGGWVIPYIDAVYSGSRNYYPYFVTPDNGYWGSVAVWGLTMEVELA